MAKEKKSGKTKLEPTAGTTALSVATPDVDKVIKLELYEANPETTEIPLSRVILMSETPIPEAQTAMREINQAHVDNMYQAFENGDVLPPIDVVRSNLGPDGSEAWIMYDGGHRFVVNERYVEQHYVNDSFPLEQALEKYTISAKEHTVEDPDEIVMLAFKANLKHGLPATKNSRGRYGSYLYDKVLEVQVNDKQAGIEVDGTFLKSMRDCAKLAGCTHTNINDYRNRKAHKLGKMLDELVGPDALDDAKQYEEEAQLAEASKDANKYESAFKSLNRLVKYFASLGFTRGEAHEMLKGHGDTSIDKDQVEQFLLLVQCMHEQAKEPSEPEQHELPALHASTVQ
jgi:hypothetical protein